MSQLLAHPAAGPAPRRMTTAQILHLTRATAAGTSAAPTGISLHQFTELLDQHLELTPLELHRCTTILTKQIDPLLGRPGLLQAVRTLVADPNRIATADGRTAVELCGSAWHQICSQAVDLANAAIDGAERYGVGTVLQLAVLRTTQCHMPWWGTPQWEARIDDWCHTARCASALKRTARESPELLDDDILHEIIAG